MRSDSLQNAGGRFKAGLLVAERVVVQGNGIHISRLMGRHVDIRHMDESKPGSRKSIDITAAYGDQDMLIDAGRPCSPPASSSSPACICLSALD